MEEKARQRKMCADPKCREEWIKLEQTCPEAAASFIFCPFCAEELNMHCSSCHEALADPNYQYCPWCGREFEK